MDSPGYLDFFAALPKEILESRINVLLVIDADADESFLTLEPVLEDREQGSGRSAIAGCALFADFAVAEQVAGFDELISEPDGLVVVRVIVVPVGEMEGVDVPIARGISVLYYVQRQPIS